MTNVLFDCDYCEGPVTISTGPGRSHSFRSGVVLQIPEDFATAVCQSCGRVYLTSDEAAQLDRHFEARLAAECRELVDVIQERTGLSQKQVELAAGVTPTYLSHVTGGRKQPSGTLFGLLECLARHPEEAVRRVEAKHWSSAGPSAMSWKIEEGALAPQSDVTLIQSQNTAVRPPVVLQLRAKMTEAPLSVNVPSPDTNDPPEVLWLAS